MMEIILLNFFFFRNSESMVPVNKIKFITEKQE